MVINLYLMNISPPCRSVVLAAKYLGIEINKIHVNLLKKEHLTEEFLEMNPQHTVPTIDDNGFYLWESRAIMAYLVNKYAPDSNLYPKDPMKRANVDKMLYFDIGTLYKSIADSITAILLKGEKWDSEKEKVVNNAMHSLEVFLEKSPFVAGEHLTIADLSIITYLENLKLFKESVIELDFSIYPRIEAWMKRVEDELPYYKEITQPGLEQLKAFLKMNEDERKKLQH